MSRSFTAVIFFAVLVLGMAVSRAHAQYSALSAPFNSAGSSFSENIGVGWGISGPNFFFNNGGGAPPPFGGHNPGADGGFGFNARGNNLNFSFGLHGGQGSNTTFGSQTATIVVPNGGVGALFDGRQRPFVTGVIPVVGDAWPVAPMPSMVSPLAERLSRLRTERPTHKSAAEDRAVRANAAPLEARSRLPAADSPAKDDPPLVLGVK